MDIGHLDSENLLAFLILALGIWGAGRVTKQIDAFDADDAPRIEAASADEQANEIVECDCDFVDLALTVFVGLE